MTGWRRTRGRGEVGSHRDSARRSDQSSDTDGLVRHPEGFRVVVYSRDGCHLCEQVVSVVAATCADLGVDWAEVDVDAPDHPRLRAMFGEQVPVTFVDGRRHDFWRIDPQRLRAALAVRTAPGG